MRARHSTDTVPLAAVLTYVHKYYSAPIHKVVSTSKEVVRGIIMALLPAITWRSAILLDIGYITLFVHSLAVICPQVVCAIVWMLAHQNI